MDKNKSDPHESPIREHTFDGIQEYDKKMPNWWLFTLYGAIAFSIGYWIYYQKTATGLNQIQEYELALGAIEVKAEAVAAAMPTMGDEMLWQMSRDPAVVEAGKATYAMMCASCHGPELKGLVGVNLVDAEWVHGGEPMQIRALIMNGSLLKGMPGWLPILGEQKINEAAAFILSHHQKP